MKPVHSSVVSARQQKKRIAPVQCGSAKSRRRTPYVVIYFYARLRINIVYFVTICVSL